VTVTQLEQRMILTPIDAVDAYLVHIVKDFREKNEKGLVSKHGRLFLFR
jgi:hypothetical protein